MKKEHLDVEIENLATEVNDDLSKQIQNRYLLQINVLKNQIKRADIVDELDTLQQMLGETFDDLNYDLRQTVKILNEIVHVVRNDIENNDDKKLNDVKSVFGIVSSGVDLFDLENIFQIANGKMEFSKLKDVHDIAIKAADNIKPANIKDYCVTINNVIISPLSFKP